jgi:hypothetical protein
MAREIDHEVLEMDRWLTSALAPVRHVDVKTSDRVATATWSRIEERPMQVTLIPFLASTRRRVAAAALMAGIAVSPFTPIGQNLAAAAEDAVHVVERALVAGPGHAGDQIEPATRPGFDEQPAP